MKNKLTPLEMATRITIESPQDIIMGWEGTSKLIYCYKNDKNIIEWLSLLSDDLIENAVESGSFSDLNDRLSEDFLQIGLYLNMMKNKDWGISVKEELIVKTVNILLATSFSMESINRTLRKQWGEGRLPGSGNLLDMIQNKENKYDISSYSVQPNPLYDLSSYSLQRNPLLQIKEVKE